MSPVRPSCAVRLACRCAHVGSCAPPCAPDRYGKSGDGTGEQMFCPRAHCLSENRSRRLSALRSAVKTAERSEALA